MSASLSQTDKDAPSEQKKLIPRHVQHIPPTVAQQKITPHPTLVAHEKDETQRRRLRLFYLIVLTVWTFAAISAPFVVFCLTKNPASFFGFSTLAPPLILWAGFAKFLLMDERRFELEKMRLQNQRRENINSS